MSRNESAVCLEAHPDYALGSWRNVFVVSWRWNTTLAAAQELAKNCAAFALSHPEGIGMLTIIENGAPAPPGDARASVASFLGEADYIKASAVAMEGSGFRAAAVRSIVAGMSMLARQPFPHKVFASFDEALDWLVPEMVERCSSDLPRGDLGRAITAFRRQVDADVPRTVG